jgi:hypothetical protein
MRTTSQRTWLLSATHPRFVNSEDLVVNSVSDHVNPPQALWIHHHRVLHSDNVVVNSVGPTMCPLPQRVLHNDNVVMNSVGPTMCPAKCQALLIRHHHRRL